MIHIHELREYLEAQGVVIPVVSGLEPLENPDRVIFATPEGGNGELRERTFERAEMQIRCRGARNNPRDALVIAALVDDLLMEVAYPIQIAGRHVTTIQWVGGFPRLATRDSARRHIAVATYSFEIARELAPPVA